MRPESLPKAYHDFIQKTGPVAQPVYKAVRDCCRGGPVDVASLSAYVATRGKFAPMNLEEFPSNHSLFCYSPGYKFVFSSKLQCGIGYIQENISTLLFIDFCAVICSASTKGCAILCMHGGNYVLSGVRGRHCSSSETLSVVSLPVE